MNSSYSAKKRLSVGKRTAVFLLFFCLLASFLIAPARQAHAQIPVTDAIGTAWTAGQTVWQKITNVLKTLWQKGGSMAFQQVVRSALNKFAYDTANYLGSGGKGQKPLFITQNWGDYLSQMADEAGGEFIEGFFTNLSKPMDAECQTAYQACVTDKCAGILTTPDDAFCGEEGHPSCKDDSKSANAESESCIKECKTEAMNCDNKKSQGMNGGTGSINLNSGAYNLCQPSSLEAKVKIGLGLVAQNRPDAPNCTASEMVQNWGDEAQRLADIKDPYFLNKIKGIFEPSSNDLGIYMNARMDMLENQDVAKENSELKLSTGKGWDDKTNIAKKLVGIPGKAEREAASTETAQKNSLLRTTGDIVIDAANVFLNQYAITKFNDLMAKLGEKSSKSGNPDVKNAEADSGIRYGEGSLKEVTASLIKPDFGVRADYDILSELMICPDAKNPGPTNCVLDEKFMQGITEKKTVAEALADGFLHADWQLSKDTIPNTYSLRNISILRKYRILPVGWEEAVNKAFLNPNSPKKVTLNDLVSCYDANDTYNQFSSNFNINDQSWCRGLVDPSWVLKAPLNYCAKEGVSSQILSKMVMPSIPGTNGNPYTPSSLTVTRAENYCGDEKTCIKEKADGSCEAYGYCNEEKRTWNFSTESCDPVNNTCQSFSNIATGKSASYLQNTLDYSGCDADSAGCRLYAIGGAFASSTNTVNWAVNQTRNFNKNLAGCNGKDEGCTELLRVKPTWGSNLVMDAAFMNEGIGASSTDDQLLGTWPYWGSAAVNRRATIVDSSLEPGGSSGLALRLSAERGGAGQIVIGTYSDTTHRLVPEDFELIKGQAYTFSADVFLMTGHKAHIYMGEIADNYIQSTDETGKWVHLSLARTAGGSFTQPLFGVNADNISGNDIIVYIKNLKFELSNYETSFSLYGAYKVYEKLIPPYLEKACYMSVSGASKDYRLRDDAPSVCYQFARRCNQTEAGCELFRSDAKGLSVPAKVSSGDYCPSDCLGYDVYVAKQDRFHSTQAENMIPARAQSCSLEAAGCTEFTNLDKQAQGGEAREYYTYLKSCIKPSTSDCASFYSWEGTDQGYQLRAYSLKKDNAGGPAVTSPDGALCNATIYTKPLTDPQHNSDCREFYNASGQVFYHLISRTVTCSDDCHPYRQSDKNIDETLSQGQCSGTDKHWDASTNSCYVCLSGGSWDALAQACVYQAIPGEGQTCNSAEKGCREYNGNGGNNVMTIGAYDFETGAQGWTSNCTNALSISAISNSRGGHSLYYRNSGSSCQAIGQPASASVVRQPLIKSVLADPNIAAQLKLGTRVTQGRAYSLRFLARSDNAAHPDIYFMNNSTSSPARAYFATSSLVVKGGGEWGIYETNLANLDHAVTDNETLVITADKAVYFDDIVLTEITDRYYLISGSSQVPSICYYDIFDQYQGPDYNLGCTQYTDRAGLKHNLHKFSQLCSDSAVGCEQMISTENYEPTGSGIWKDTNNNGKCDQGEDDCVFVPGDHAVYAVYDSSKLCNQADAGCSRLGLSTGINTWSDVFKKNDPDNYDKTLCGAGEIGCDEWRADDGSVSYFRDPGNQACQYRNSHDPAIPGKAWYQIPVQRCDLNSDGQIGGNEKSGAICSSTSDCSNKPCIVDNNDYFCSTNYFKTFGLGGSGNQVPVPDDRAALCEKVEAGCTEYIDPVSRYSPNIVYNPFFFNLQGGTRDGWGPQTGEKWNGANLAADEQVVTIEPNRLYIFSVSNPGALPTSITFLNGVKELLPTNNLGTTTNSFTIPANSTSTRYFASLNNNKLKVSGGESGKEIVIKSSIISYQLKSNVDKTSCNGIADTDNGCVLFNERSVEGASGLASLVGKWDAKATSDRANPKLCASGGACTSNTLVKVRPDRVCSKWLDCITYYEDPVTKERTCYSVGQCTRLDDKNECAAFEEVIGGNLNYNLPMANANATGYYLLNKYHISNMKEVGLNTEAHYDFEDSVPALFCSRGVGGGACSFNKNIISDLLIREPQGAPTDYPAHGASFLKVPAKYTVSPQTKNGFITVIQNQTYYLNLLVNTKNSGLGAKVMIYGKNGQTESFIDDETFHANNGWQRFIFSFNSGSYYGIKIYITADDNTSDANVYVDDINIEPVLDISQTAYQHQYVSRECRLYPTADSLTCVNKNNNVLEDGLEGYCLEHDNDNPSVCQLWYPSDQISSTQSARNTLGYQGAYPLNYCTEVNGNFDLVEKRKTVNIDERHNNNKNEYGDSRCYVYSGECNGDPNYNKVVEVHKGDVSAWEFQYCIPKKDKLKVITVDKPLVTTFGHCSSEGIREYAGWGLYDGFQYWKAGNTHGCENNACQDLDEAKNDENPVKVYSYDEKPEVEENLKLITGQGDDKLFRLSCNNFIQLVDYNGANKAWTGRVSVNSTWPSYTPPYFVDPTTPNASFFGPYGSSQHNLMAYGRNRETVPFGAASWPDDFNLSASEPVPLKNQYSNKIKEDVLAGRPYGCSNYAQAWANGCASIGYCSLDPSIYCLVGLGTSTDFVSRRTCGEGGYGNCVPLWSNYLGRSDNGQLATKRDYDSILRNLFLQSFNSYALKDGSYTTGVTSIDYQSMTECSGGVRPLAATSSIANSLASFCANKPKISNVKVKFNDVVVGNDSFTVAKRGIYKLEFNSEVDAEQQPLKQIFINWGDGKQQFISGIDNKPRAGDPHIFYHFYSEVGQKGLMVEVRDNWGQKSSVGSCSVSPGVCIGSVFE